MKKLSKLLSFVISFVIVSAVLFPNDVISQRRLAEPSPNQFRWQEQDRIMFIHFGMATWQGREYDNFSTDLKRVNPAKLNTDQWCRAAKSWGAKQIIFVAKHVGGFCWWPTTSTDYNVSNIAWKNGGGDVFKELSASCKKYGLGLGVYIYPGDDRWGAGLGSGGKTNDPSKQEAYNKVYRQQVTEVLTRYGKMQEVWFDGSCIIDVGDILAKYAKEAVIFQGPQASIRWSGNEAGQAPYPAWNSLDSADLLTGVATSVQGNPDGNAWAPLECDVTLYNHNWFWSENNEKKRRNLGELMEIYYKSAGRGAIMLLNATPDTSGLIPEGDMKRYAELGAEIDRRFSRPLATIVNKKGSVIELPLGKPTAINHIVIMEDYRRGERIRGYKVEGYVNGRWQKLSEGSSIGRKKIDWFGTVAVSGIRLQITKSAGEPLLRSISLYDIDNTPELEQVRASKSGEWKFADTWSEHSFTMGRAPIEVDLSPFIDEPGQYELKFEQVGGKDSLRIEDAELWYDGEKALPEFLTRKGQELYINRTAQVTPETTIRLKVVCSAGPAADSRGNILVRKTPL
ncbi:MAG: alpha-L-fucosidase [Puia sp.]|nr:alpha-L-fucosidase [Puia sp.]